ncbi:MAG TPA: CHRD domain-containing protein [Candidatus Limnocylindrales bacterium]|nr:CHRD domain-containing protein [Candidatus Limnocylindrales bacterium]
MRRFLGLGAVVALIAMLPAAAMAGGRPIVVDMTGAEEAPGPGDPDGSGTAWFTFNSGQGEVCFALHVEDIVLPAIGAHIHIAPAGSPGPVVVPLTPPDATGHSSGCVSADPALVKAIRKSPSGYYVNVHSTDFPAGAVRAQLAP